VRKRQQDRIEYHDRLDSIDGYQHPERLDSINDYEHPERCDEAAYQQAAAGARQEQRPEGTRALGECEGEGFNGLRNGVQLQGPTQNRSRNLQRTRFGASSRRDQGTGSADL